MPLNSFGKGESSRGEPTVEPGDGVTFTDATIARGRANGNRACGGLPLARSPAEACGLPHPVGAFGWRSLGLYFCGVSDDNLIEQINEELVRLRATKSDVGPLAAVHIEDRGS